MEGEPVALIERLAALIADAVMEKYEYVDKVMVRVYKPQVALPGILRHVAVEITRTRPIRYRG